MPSAPEAVHSEAEANGTAHKMVHAESEPCVTQYHQLASSSEVIVDSDSVYSVCCSDVTSDTPDIVHIDQETPPVPNETPVPNRGTASHLDSLPVIFLSIICSTNNVAVTHVECPSETARKQ